MSVKRGIWARMTVAFLLVVVSLSVSPIRLLGNPPWVNHVILSDTTSAEPGLAPFGAKLYLSWVGTDPSRTLNVESSTDGLSYSNHVVLQNIQNAQGGAAIVGCAQCNQLYMAIRNTSSAVLVTRSSDGINWAYPTPVPILPGVDSTPALSPFGNGAVAFTTQSCQGGTARRPHVANFNDCSLSSFTTCPVGLPTCGTIFTNVDCLLQANSPLGWNNTTTGDVRVFSCAGGSGCQSGNLYYTIGAGSPVQITGDTSGQGPRVTVTPSGAKYIAYRGTNSKIYVRNIGSGARVSGNDWSNSSPAIAYFNGYLYVVWRGGDNKLNVASISPF
jgi:hypothetical protein